MDRHAGVAEHGLGARGGHRHEPLGALDRVADEPQGAGHLLVVDLLVGERSLTARAPVDDVATAVDQALLVEALERQQHGARVGGIQREPLARPVRGDPHPAELLEDQPAVLLLPLPHFLEEALAAQLEPASPLLGEPLLDHVLGRDPGVVHAGQVEHLAPLHAPPAHHQVADRFAEQVAHGERAGHVGGRDRDHERLAARGLRAEHAALFPERVPAGLDPARVVGLSQRLRPRGMYGGNLHSRAARWPDELRVRDEGSKLAQPRKGAQTRARATPRRAASPAISTPGGPGRASDS